MKCYRSNENLFLFNKLIERLLSLDIQGYLKKFPDIPEGHKVVCWHKDVTEERLYVCETLEDMKNIYDKFISGEGISIGWHHIPEKLLP